PFRQIVKRGEHFFLVREDDREIDLGNNLESVSTIRKAILNNTKDLPGGPFLVRSMKPYAWMQVMRLIVANAVEQDLGDGEQTERFRSILRGYLEVNTPYDEADYKQAYQDSSPYRRRGLLHVNVMSLVRYAQSGLGLRLEDSEVRLHLMRLGFVA